MSDLILNKKRARVDSDESPEVKRLRDDLLSTLDDSDLFATSSDLLATSSEFFNLDSFIKTFEKEISPPVVDLTSESGESGPDLGFLLGASDDELGIPPANGEERILDGIGEMWRYEDELTSYYNSFEYGYIYNDDDDCNNNNIGYEYSDTVGLDFYEAPLPLWRPETTPAI